VSSMTVRVVHYQPNGYGNILWRESFPMRYGKFPKNHPCADNPEPFCMLGDQRHVVPGEPPQSTDALGVFRSRGYQASCFPEGDGICFVPPTGRTADEVTRDIRECFGWQVKP